MPTSTGPPVEAGRPSADEQHVFIVVGVPGSGKDTVLKRCAEKRRARGSRLPPLSPLTAVTPLQVHPLARARVDGVGRRGEGVSGGVGADERSARAPQQRGARAGKHLLHAQRLRRESILVTDTVVARALEQAARR